MRKWKRCNHKIYAPTDSKIRLIKIRETIFKKIMMNQKIRGINQAVIKNKKNQRAKILIKKKIKGQ